MNTARQFAWQTTNMEYGKFYSLIAEEEQKKLTGEREGRCNILTKTLIKCRNQLGLMRLRDSRFVADVEDDFEPRRPSQSDSDPKRLEMADKPLRKNQKKIKSAHSGTDEAKLSEPSVERSLVSIDQTPATLDKIGRIDPTGIEEDTKQLEWVLNRLAEKLQPLTSGGLPVLTFTPSNAESKVCKAELGHRPKAVKQCTHCNPDRPTVHIVPPYARYGFYRYYGYAGQGAKTSWGHNLPLGQKAPYGKRTRGQVFKY